MKSSGSLALVGKLAECILDILRNLGDSARPLLAGDGRVRPERAEHLKEVRLTAAVEPTHPDARLFRLTKIAQVAIEDATQTDLILALADERLQLVLQGPKLRISAAGLHL